MLWLILLFFIVSSCTSEKSDINVFAEKCYINEYDSIYSDVNDVLSSVTDLDVIDDVVIFKHREDEYNFSFIETKTGKLLTKWARVGNGPNEFIQLGAGFTVVDSTLVFLDIAKKKINIVEINDILRNDVKQIKQISYPYTREFRPMRFTLVDDLIYFLGSFEDGRLGGMNLSSDSIFMFSDFRFDCTEVPQMYRGVVYQGLLKGNNKRKKFVCMTYSSDLFEIYSYIGGNIERTFSYPHREEPKVAHVDNRFLSDYENSIVGLKKMSVSDDLICFMYSPLKNVDDSGLSDEILCFDWEGNKVKKYILPFPIKDFCVSKEYIYGIRYVQEDLVLYRFRL